MSICTIQFFPRIYLVPGADLAGHRDVVGRRPAVSGGGRSGDDGALHVPAAVLRVLRQVGAVRHRGGLVAAKQLGLPPLQVLRALAPLPAPAAAVAVITTSSVAVVAAASVAEASTASVATTASSTTTGTLSIATAELLPIAAIAAEQKKIKKKILTPRKKKKTLTISRIRLVR